MTTQAPGRGAVMLAVAFTLSCIGLIAFVWTQFSGTVPLAPRGYEVHALFPESGLLVPGADVRISGVNVGRVTGSSSHGRGSQVTMDISAPYAPIPANTRAILRQKTLLGEAYVELSAGDRAGRKLRDGGTIPRSQVAPTQQLDQVLSAFGRPTQRALQEFLQGGAASLAGRAAQISQGIANLDPAVADLRTISQALDQQRGDVQRLFRETGAVFSTLSQRSGQVRSLIVAGDQVLSATAARNRALAATVDALPPFLGGLRSTLKVADKSLRLARPSVQALLPVAPMLRPVLSDLIALEPAAVSLLHAAPRLLHDALRALPAVTSFSRTFRPALDALVPALKQISPVINFIGLYQREILAAMGNLAATLEATAPAATTGWPDHPGTASYLRALTAIGNETPFGQSIREPTNRDNSYFSPGELSFLGRGGLLSASCANTGNVSQAHLSFKNVPCRVQPGFHWDHLVRYYPHVTSGSK
jgi:phospholipid/cholesterol/gamma-HCH transport system substrate-binding protein